jgi:hypothetical protein
LLFGLELSYPYPESLEVEMRAGLIFLGLMLGLTGVALAAGNADEIKSLGGRPALRVVVAPLNQGAMSAGMNEAKIKNLLSARLEFSRVGVKGSGWPMLLADVSCYGRLCFLGLQVLQPVQLVRTPRQRLVATTWLVRGACGSDRILRAVARMCDRLIKDYHRAR